VAVEPPGALLPCHQLPSNRPPTHLSCHLPPASRPAGVPVIWHDNFVVYGEEAAHTSRLISDMTSAEFRQLAPINSTSAADDSASLAGDDTPLGSSPCGSTISLASMGSAISALSGMTSSSSSGRLLRKHNNDVPAQPNEPTLRTWQCEEEDHFPTLAEVFAGIPADVAFDIVSGAGLCFAAAAQAHAGACFALPHAASEAWTP
jgi:hypothetical protein